MSSYQGKHAELYDIFYSDKEYDKEIFFVHQCLQQYGLNHPKKILELACGTGSHAFELEKLGYTIIATDYSEDMLKCAQSKAKKISSSVNFKVQDMRDLDVPERPFDAVICLFDSIGYVITNDALKQVFQNVHQHLRKGGLFIFEFWHAAAMLKYYDPLRVRKWETVNGEITRISETTLDVVRQVGNVKYSILELKKSGTFSKIEEIQENRYFLVQEMNMWLKQNNFEPLKYFAGFKNDEKISGDTWHIVAISRRK
jgi:ubiquinone/menaquinone biosynthesis C-methylase UbiE